MAQRNLEAISIQKVLKAVTMDKITQGVSTDATSTPFRSWADEEDPVRENEREQPERQTKNQASIMSWKPSEQNDSRRDRWCHMPQVGQTR